MHSRTESGIPLDWEHVREIKRQEREAAEERRIAEKARQLGRQLTPVELETAKQNKGAR